MFTCLKLRRWFFLNTRLLNKLEKLVDVSIYSEAKEKGRELKLSRGKTIFKS